jgi:uncharacterized membrane protein YkvA (DUF1232 family)
MKDIDLLLEEDTADYQGEYQDIIRQAPAFYCLMTNLLEEPALPGRFRPLILAAIAYFVLPTEIYPEYLEGPMGYIDDIFLCALVTDQIRRELNEDDILKDNWEGSVPLLPLIQDILSQVGALIGDKRELILWYIGYEYIHK